nr:hypothetical protein [Streptomyces sp. F001]
MQVSGLGLGAGARKEVWAGLENYTDAFTDSELLDGALRVLGYGCIVVPVMLGLALLFALMLDSRRSGSHPSPARDLPAVRHSRRRGGAAVGIPVPAGRQSLLLRARQAGLPQPTCWTAVRCSSLCRTSLWAAPAST